MSHHNQNCSRQAQVLDHNFRVQLNANNSNMQTHTPTVCVGCSRTSSHKRAISIHRQPLCDGMRHAELSGEMAASQWKKIQYFQNIRGNANIQYVEEQNS